MYCLLIIQDEDKTYRLTVPKLPASEASVEIPLKTVNEVVRITESVLKRFLEPHEGQSRPGAWEEVLSIFKEAKPQDDRTAAQKLRDRHESIKQSIRPSKKLLQILEAERKKDRGKSTRPRSPKMNQRKKSRRPSH